MAGGMILDFTLQLSADLAVYHYFEKTKEKVINSNLQEGLYYN